MSKDLDNPSVRRAIARRMRREHDDMLRANEQETHFLRRLVRDSFGFSLPGLVLGGGVLTWYRGAFPAPWQIGVLVGLAVVVPLVRVWMRKQRED